MKNSLLLLLITLSIGSTVRAKVIDCGKYCTNLGTELHLDDMKLSGTESFQFQTLCSCTSTQVTSCDDFDVFEQQACKKFCGGGIAGCDDAPGTAAATCVCQN